MLLVDVALGVSAARPPRTAKEEGLTEFPNLAVYRCELNPTKRNTCAIPAIALPCALDSHHSTSSPSPTAPSPFATRKIVPDNVLRHLGDLPARHSLAQPARCSSPPVFALPDFSFSRLIPHPLSAPCLSAEFSTTRLLPPVPPSPLPRAPPPSTHRCPTCLPSPTPSPSLLFILANTTRVRVRPGTTPLPLVAIHTNLSLIKVQADGTLIRATMSRATSFRWVPVETITLSARLLQLLPGPVTRSKVLLALITRKVKMNMLPRNGGRQ